MINKNRQQINKKFKFNAFICIKFLLCLFLILNLISCTKKLIDYDLEIVETKAEETKVFSFEKSNNNLEQSKVVTKKDKDKLVNEHIKEIIKKRTRKPVIAKGIYLPAYVAGNPERFEPIFQNIINSDINTIVVDIKDELGRITIGNDSEIVKDLKTSWIQINDAQSFIDRCHENNIYVVARIVSFLDNFAPRQDTEIAIKTKTGKLYRDAMGYYWLNPYKEKTREYLKQIALSAADSGFDEIQMDYFRFSTDRGMRNVEFDEADMKGLTRIELITNFAQELYTALIEKNVFFSIDVYGSIINSYKDQWNIGQDFPNLIKYCDYICPMIYPSHYANKTFGFDVPDLFPHDTIYKALTGATSVIDNSYDNTSHYGIVRPWLQGFTANWLETYMVYDPKELREQIQAAKEAGYEEWLFWQGGGVYKWDAFLYPDTEKKDNEINK